MRCSTLLLAGCLVIANVNGDTLSGSFYGASKCPMAQGWYPVPEAICMHAELSGAGYHGEIHMSEIPEGCIKVCSLSSCNLYFNRRVAEANLLDNQGADAPECKGNMSAWNWNGRTCSWYADPTDTPSCSYDTDAAGMKAADVCPQCGQCYFSCTHFKGACPNGKFNTGAGGKCPGAEQTCTESACCAEKATCSDFNGACPSGQYNPVTSAYNQDAGHSAACPGAASSCDAALCCKTTPQSSEISPVCNMPGMMEAIENEKVEPEKALNLTVLLGASAIILGFMAYVIKARRTSRTDGFQALLA